MLQANPKDLRKSPGGRAGLTIIYLSVCYRDDTHCVGKKISGSLVSPFLKLQTLLSFPSRSYRRHLLIANLQLRICNCKFLSFLDISQRKNRVSCFFSETGRRRKNGIWNVERQSKGSGGGFLDFQDFYLLQASFCIPYHC